MAQSDEGPGVSGRAKRKRETQTKAKWKLSYAIASGMHKETTGGEIRPDVEVRTHNSSGRKNRNQRLQQKTLPLGGERHGKFLS